MNQADAQAMTRKEQRKAVLGGIAAGRPAIGPQTIHIDVTNACNAACITCWDHSPLLATPRPAAWKKRRLELETYRAVIRDAASMGSVRTLILSGMGDPLVHPDIYTMIREAKDLGWEVTVLSNLVAADPEALVASGVDQVLAGVHGASPRTYLAFHPGWEERHFAALCRALRALGRAGIATKHVQVINQDNARDLVEMVKFGHHFGAARINFKLASLDGGTEACGIDSDTLAWLRDSAVDEAHATATRLGVKTNLELFAAQLRGAADHARTTTPMDEVGCFMGYAYTRITVDLDALYCCNTEVHIGSLHDAPLSTLWFGAAWQAQRDALRQGRYAKGCDRCGKFEQNRAWSERVRTELGDATWRAVTGHNEPHAPALPRSGPRLPVVSGP